jgi:hypothetical protein
MECDGLLPLSKTPRLFRNTGHGEKRRQLHAPWPPPFLNESWWAEIMTG